jgi:hypothetical protein
MRLREPLKVYATHDRSFRYMTPLRTLPITYLCARHPAQRLMCDKPGSEVGPGCVDWHMANDHTDELPASCFTCSEPIPEDEVLSVISVITLREQLTVYYGPDREFRYVDAIQTLPVAYLCKRHYAQVDVPMRMVWPSR